MCVDVVHDGVSPADNQAGTMGLLVTWPVWLAIGTRGFAPRREIDPPRPYPPGHRYGGFGVAQLQCRVLGSSEIAPDVRQFGGMGGLTSSSFSSGVE